MPFLLAQTLRRLHAIAAVPSDDDLHALTRRYRLRVLEEPRLANLPRIRELYLQQPGRRGGFLLLRPGLTRPWRRWLTAHGLVHHLLHAGNHLFASDMPAWAARRQETQANTAAGYLFWAHLAEIAPEMVPPVEAPELAELAEVPVSCVEGWRSQCPPPRRVSEPVLA